MANFAFIAAPLQNLGTGKTYYLLLVETEPSPSLIYASELDTASVVAPYTLSNESYIGGTWGFEDTLPINVTTLVNVIGAVIVEQQGVTPDDFDQLVAYSSLTSLTSAFVIPPGTSNLIMHFPLTGALNVTVPGGGGGGSETA